MAVYQFLPATGTNGNGSSDWRNLFTSTVVTTHAPTVFFITNADGTTTEIDGTGFSYNFAGNLVAGTITGAKNVASGVTVEQITGVTGVSAAAFWTALKGGTPALAYDALLSGTDTIMASTATSITGNMYYDGGAGQDTLDLSAFNATGGRVGFGSVAAEGEIGSTSHQTFNNIEAVLGSSGADSFYFEKNRPNGAVLPTALTIDGSAGTDNLQVFSFASGTSTTFDFRPYTFLSIEGLNFANQTTLGATYTVDLLATQFGAGGISNTLSVQWNSTIGQGFDVVNIFMGAASTFSAKNLVNISLNSSDFLNIDGSLAAGGVTITGANMGGKISGGIGNDNFYVFGAETLDGGAGANTLYALSSGATWTLNSAQIQNVQIVSLYTGVVGGTVDATTTTEFDTLYGAASGSTTLKAGAFGAWLIAEGGTNFLDGIKTDAAHGDIFVGGHGTSTMRGGLGTNYFYVGTGDSVQALANAALNWETTLSADMHINLQTDGGVDVVSLAGGGVASADATGSFKFVTLYGGSAGGTYTLTTGTGGGWMIGEGGTAVMNGGAGSLFGNTDLFVGGNGTASAMWGGSGINYYYVDGDDQVHGGGLVNHVIALATDMNFQINPNFTAIQQIDLLGGTNTVDLTNQSGYIYVFGWTGNDTIIAGGANSGGNEIFAGRGGSDTFKFANGFGTDAISDWAAGTTSHIDLTALATQGVHGIADLQIATSGGNTYITHVGHGSGTDTLALNGYIGGLAAGNFMFA